MPKDEDESLTGRPLLSAVAFEGSEPIAEARHAARHFMTAVQADCGLPVSERALDEVELVVSELATNAYKYAPGPYLLDLEVAGGAVLVSVWDTDPTLPSVSPPDPERVGRHGLEIAMAVCRSLEARREPVGKRVKAAIALADDPDGGPIGRMA